MRPQPGGFPVEITVDADQGAEQDGDQQASGCLRGDECCHRAASSCVGPSVATSPAGRPPRSTPATIARRGTGCPRPPERIAQWATVGSVLIGSVLIGHYPTVLTGPTRQRCGLHTSSGFSRRKEPAAH